MTMRNTEEQVRTLNVKIYLRQTALFQNTKVQNLESPGMDLFSPNMATHQTTNTGRDSNSQTNSNISSRTATF